MKATLLRFLHRSPLARYLFLAPIFWGGYLLYGLTGRTAWASYFCFRKLYGQTRGGVNERIARAIRARNPPLNFATARGILGAGAEPEEEIARAVAALDHEGYYVAPAGLTLGQCEALRAFARARPARPVPAPADGTDRLAFDPSDPRAPTYVFDEADLLALPVVQQLLGDRSLMLLAQRYLGAPPIIDEVTMWWSAPFGAASSEAAQCFHFDMDRVRWLKVFFYLTDVGPENGPHVYVRGTHRTKPIRFYEDRRFSDGEVATAFAADDVVTLAAPAGTMIVGDTRCLHKGQAVRAGGRLLLQIEYTISLFGRSYAQRTLPADVDSALRETRERYPSVFRRFRSRRPSAIRREAPHANEARQGG